MILVTWDKTTATILLRLRQAHVKPENLNSKYLYEQRWMTLYNFRAYLSVGIYSFFNKPAYNCLQLFIPMYLAGCLYTIRIPLTIFLLSTLMQAVRVCLLLLLFMDVCLDLCTY